MIKFSIITCTYNAESVLQRTLDSVMKQTCCNVEHLIIDGKSKDKTLAMVKAYKHKNDVGESAHEIRVFSERDTDIVNMDGRFLRHRRLSPPKKLTWRSFIWGMLVCHQSFYARTDIAKSEHYDLDYRFSADVDWCIRMMKASKAHKLPLRNVGAVITNYLDGGMSVQNHKDSLKERFQVMKHHYGLLPTLLAHAWFLIRGVFKK